MFVGVTRRFLLVLSGFGCHVADESHKLCGHAGVGLKKVSDGCSGVFGFRVVAGLLGGSLEVFGLDGSVVLVWFWPRLSVMISNP